MTDYNLTEEKIAMITEILTSPEDECLKEETSVCGEKSEDLNNEIGLEEVNDMPIGVYVKVNDEGFITDVDSEIFISNFDGWTKIDEGYGDKYAHAQSQYFDSPLIDENGNYLIKIK